MYKAELIRHRGPWPSVAHVEAATAWWVGWSNNRRLYRPLGDIPPAEYEPEPAARPAAMTLPAPAIR